MSASKAKMITRLLKRTGSKSNVKIIRNVGGVRDSLNGNLTGETVETIDTLSFVSGIPNSLIDGVRIQVGDKQVLFDNSVNVIMSDTIKIKDAEFKVIIIDGYDHAGVQQFWRVICRG